MKLIKKIKKNIQDGCYFSKGETVIIGVSGGPDSTALTYILHALQYDLGFHLHIAHYNHNLHRQADNDQKFVEKIADQLNVPCSTGFWKNPPARKRGSLEEAARQQRFLFLNKLAKKIKARAVVLAHTHDDQAETILMRILRGTGLQGLRGILPVNKINDVYYIRPMLNIPKDEILDFLAKKNISFRVDPTNKQSIFFRNKVRLELLPLLAENYNSNISKLLTNLADNVNTDYNYLEGHGQKIFSKLAKYSARHKQIRFELNGFSKQHPAIRRMLVRHGIKQLQGNTNRLTLGHFREIEDLLQNRPKKSIVHLPNKIQILKDSRFIILSHN